MLWKTVPVEAAERAHLAVEVVGRHRLVVGHHHEEAGRVGAEEVAVARVARDDLRERVVAGDVLVHPRKRALWRRRGPRAAAGRTPGASRVPRRATITTR